MPGRLSRYASNVGRTALGAVDRVFDTPLGRLLAYLLVVLVAAYAFTGLTQAQQEACEDDNRFLTVELPRAFEQHDRDLGAVLLGADSYEDLSPEDQAMIEAFIRTSQANLARALPEREC